MTTNCYYGAWRDSCTTRNPKIAVTIRVDAMYGGARYPPFTVRSLGMPVYSAKGEVVSFRRPRFFPHKARDVFRKLSISRSIANTDPDH